MGYLIVFVVSLAVGVAVFFAMMRQAAPAGTAGFGTPADDDPPADPGPGMAYVPVAESRHDWQARMTGVLGLVVSVTVGAIALAISLYAFGILIGKLIGGAVGDDPPG